LLAQAIGADMGGALRARRLHALIPWGEGPHVSALTLLPVAILCLDLALVKRKPLYYLLAALSMASVVLTNWLAGFALAMAVFSYLLANNTRRNWLTGLGVGVLSYLLAMPWVPPSTINAIQWNARTVGDYAHVYQALPTYAALGLAAALALKYLFQRWKTPAFLQFFLLFAFFMSAITLAAEWAHVAIVPQPNRYHLEMEMGLCLAGVFLARSVVGRLPRRALPIVVCALLILGYSQTIRYRRFARELIRPIDIRQTTEYKTALWFGQHMNGSRVMAPGSTSFWMNAFTDTPQLAGGFDQGVTNWQVRIATYIIYSGDGAGDKAGEIAVLWLKAFGVQAIAVGGPKSGEHYKPFRNPERFASLLEELWRDGDDRIYRVPSRSPSLAHVVRLGDLAPRPPINGIDIEPIQPYVAALENPALPEASFRWRNRRSAEITADLEPGQILSVQISHHPGWRATVKGQPRRVFSDGLGLMAIEPDCTGRCTVEIVYDGGTEMRIARWLSWMSLTGCLIWSAGSLALARHC
jgi:hypothetical protein